MSGSPTKRESPAKLTSDLLARKGQARPADLLDGDSLLVTEQNRPPLTLIRSDEPAITGLFDDNEGQRRQEATIGSGSLLDFSLAKPGSGEPPRDEVQMLGEPQASALTTDATNVDAGVDATVSGSSEPAVSASESQQAVVGVEDRALHDAGGLLEAEPPQPAAAEEDKAVTEAADSYLSKVFVLAALLVVSFAAGLWIVSWANRTPTEGVKNVNLPVESRPPDQVESDSEIPAVSAQNVPASPPTAPPPSAELAPKSETRHIGKEQVPALAGNEASVGTGPIAVQGKDLDPQVPAEPRLPTLAAETPLEPDQAPISDGDRAKSIAATDLEAAAPALEQKRAIDDQGAVPVTPKPNPNYTPSAPAQSAPAQSAKAEKPGYVVQLLAGRDLKTVTWEKDRLLRRFPQVAGPGALEVKKVETEGQRIFYRVRTAPFDDAASARNLCRALKQANQDCLVLKQ